ncbi:PREDICTED: fibulin-1-like, partial [Rhagoletis zephyria]|uniref:fibulin-1-like n=1 Tax=Rhagoletis zephyria TaxID=28612 RepID=UPI0008114146
MVETENSSNSNLTNCAKGYHFVRFSYTCEDTNECRIGQHDCDLSRERCINFPGTYRCVPLVLGEGKGSGGGDSGDAGTGAEENDKQSSARLSSLRFTQKLCPSGYERNEELNICEDSDECNSGLLPPCSENAYCQNTIGSYVCHCKTGFIKPANDSHFCEDVNECTGGLHNCFGTLKCVNTVGSFECLPRQPDFVSSSSTLNERSQIGLYSEEKCDRGQIYDSTKKTCVGKSGGGEFELGGDQTGKSRQVRCESGERIIDGECRTVSCSTGFFYNSTERRCQDLNECLQYSPCSSAEKCTNTIGSYRCSIRCTAGYQKVNFGQSCEDVDECALGTYRCPAGQVCKNRPGGYTCQCPPGYLGSADQGGSGQCEDVDECISSDGQECACKSGFQLAADGFTCVDINECETLGKPKSSDSKESNNRTALSGDAQVCYHKCINQPGSFQCTCPPGYESLSEGRICKDIDECESGELCRGQNEYCLNVHGSYRCNVINCPDDYYLDARSKKCIRHAPKNPSENYDINLPLSYSYNYLGIVSNVRIPSSGHLDLLAMSGPVFSITAI